MASDDLPNLGMQAYLVAAKANHEQRDRELGRGFVTTTPYNEEALRAAVADGGRVEVVSAGTGARYRMAVETKQGFGDDGSVCVRLDGIDGSDIDQFWWRDRVIWYTAKHTLRRGDDGNIVVEPDWRGCR